MLRYRTVRVEIRRSNVRVLVNRGEVLSPLLWNMVVDGLLRKLHKAHCQAQKGKFVITQCDRMQGALNCVENCCREIGLSVIADKTTMVLFTNNREIWGFL
jgi:hypothetical protein